MTQLTLFDIEGDGKKEKKLGIRRAIKLAETKYRDDEGVMMWLKIYREGAKGIVINKGKSKEKLDGIPPKSDFAKKGLIKAVQLREKGKVMKVKEVKGK